MRVSNYFSEVELQSTVHFLIRSRTLRHHGAMMLIFSVLLLTSWATGTKTHFVATNTPLIRQRTVLVTGGAGYIGSHTCLELLQGSTDKVVVLDNFENSSPESLRRVRELLKDDADSPQDRLIVRKCDIRDTARLRQILNEFRDISSCIHFAGKKAVGESVSQPLDYYHANVAGTVTLLRVLQEHQQKQQKPMNFVFSSSATVYGDPEVLPITEGARLSATSPYGRTKLFIEDILRDLRRSAPATWNILILRYFNPVGAHPSGRIGEDPIGKPNNLMPYISQVCVGRRKKLQIFGNDYDTFDGTGARDYIHVVDLAQGHVAALNYLRSSLKTDCRAINLGTGKSATVLQLVQCMRGASGKEIPYDIVERRPGDVAEVYADPSLASQLLKWKAGKTLEDICRDAWKWQSENPNGYEREEFASDEL